jgi:hypothetical protein
MFWVKRYEIIGWLSFSSTSLVCIAAIYLDLYNVCSL